LPRREKDPDPADRPDVPQRAVTKGESNSHWLIVGG